MRRSVFNRDFAGGVSGGVSGGGFVPKAAIRYGINKKAPLERDIANEAEERRLKAQDAKDKRPPPVIKSKIVNNAKFKEDEEEDLPESATLEAEMKFSNTLKKEKMNNTNLEVYENIAENIKNTVLNTIEKLKKSPSYIPQANAINSQIQSLINLKKVEIESTKLEISLNNKA